MKEREKIVRTLQDLQTVTKGKSRAAELVQGNNAFIGLIELDAEAKVPIHRDTREEYLYVLSGGGKIKIDGEEFDINTGTTVYMPSYSEVSYINGNEKSRFLQVFAGPEPASKYKNWEKSNFTW